MNNKSIIKFLSITLLILIIIGTGYSAAYFIAGITGSPKNISGSVITDIKVSLIIDNNGYINATELVPILASEVESSATTINFTVNAQTNPQPTVYTLKIDNISISANLKVAAFKWSLACTNNSSNDVSGTFESVASSLIMSSNKNLASNSMDNYIFRMWIEDDGTNQADMLNGTFSGKISMNVSVS